MKLRSSLFVSFAAVAVACSAQSAPRGEPTASAESDYTQACVGDPPVLALRCHATGSNGWTGNVVASKSNVHQNRNESRRCTSPGFSTRVFFDIERGEGPSATLSGIAGKLAPGVDLQAVGTTAITLTELDAIEATVDVDSGSVRLVTEQDGKVHAVLDVRAHQTFFAGADDPANPVFDFIGDFPCEVTASRP
ncbi:MAG: hypothetical protein JWP97_6538 [Labilithrix sp.]|nr:hypothetical protein [Labilithrix sp.]